MKKCRYGLAAVFSRSSSSGGDFDGNSPTGQQGNPGVVAPTSHLCIVNPLVDLSNLTVTIDGATVDSDLDGQEATNYIKLNSGQHRVVIEAPAGRFRTVRNSPRWKRVRELGHRHQRTVEAFLTPQFNR